MSWLGGKGDCCQAQNPWVWSPRCTQWKEKEKRRETSTESWPLTSTCELSQMTPCLKQSLCLARLVMAGGQGLGGTAVWAFGDLSFPLPPRAVVIRPKAAECVLTLWLLLTLSCCVVVFCWLSCFPLKAVENMMYILTNLLNIRHGLCKASRPRFPNVFNFWLTAPSPSGTYH